MPTPAARQAPTGAAAFGSGGDMFLLVQTKRAGRIKGEVTDEGHEDEIRIAGWHWAVSASSAIDSVRATAKRSYSALNVVKTVDSASTALLSALATNDEVKEARLAMRKAGGEQVDYLLITLSNARIAGVEHNADASGQVMETVSLRFAKVKVEYRTQRGSGLRGGATTFEDEIFPDA